MKNKIFTKSNTTSSFLLNSPQIVTLGNGVPIPNGDNTPSIDDNTNFGDVYSFTGNVYRFFGIKNTGNADLILNSVKITDESAGDFSFLYPISAGQVIRPNQSIGFRIDFKPKGNGIRSANIIIESNDPNNNSYSFSIQGNGLEPFHDLTGIFTDINADIQGVGSDGSYIGRSSSDWGDYDNDGDLDFVITGFSNNGFISKIYRNEGNNTFTDISAPVKKVGRGCAKWGDYDNDNDLDVVITGLASDIHQGIAIIYKNDGNDSFTQASTLSGVEFSSAIWGDCDNDGDLDVIFNGVTNGGSATFLYRNDRNNIFTLVPANFTGLNQGCVELGDLDNDGDLDLIVIGTKSDGPKTKIFRNDGNGVFTDINTSIIGLSNSSVALGDYDNDGDLDIGINGEDVLYNTHTKIFRNDGNYTFTENNTLFEGLKNGSIKFGDYNNDGDLDLVVCGSNKSIIYQNIGNGSFTKKTELIGVKSSSVSWGDYDSDGDLDLIITGDVESYQISKIYNNSINKSNKPQLPVNLQTEVNDKTVLLKWNKPDNINSQNGLTYNVYVGTSPKGVDVVSPMSNLSSGRRKVAQIGNTNHNTTLKVKNLLPGKTYYWSVQTINNSFEGSSFSEEHSFQTGILSYQPSGLTAIAGNHKAIIHWPWNQNTNIAKYYIYCSTSLYSPTKIDSTSGSMDTLFVIRNLKNNVKYYFWISAVDLNNNESLRSNSVTVTPTIIPSLTFSLDSLNFPNTAIGDSIQLRLTGYNNSFDTLSITKSSLSNSTFKVNLDPAELLPEDSISVYVIFRPDSFNTYSEILKIYTNQDTLMIPLTGSSPFPGLSLNFYRLDFPYVPMDSLRSIDLIVSNGSVNKLTIDSIVTSTKYFFLSFSKEVVSFNDSVWIKIYFSPDSLGFYTDILTLHSNAQNSIFKLPLSGNSKLSKLGLANRSLEFNSVALNQEKFKTLTVYNLSHNTLEISSIEHNNNNFRIMNSLPWYLDGSDSLQVLIKFNPSSPGSFVDTARIISNGGDSLIYLQGVCPYAEILVNYDTLDFGDVPIDSSALRQIEISSISISILEIDSISISTPFFSITKDLLPISVPYNKTQSLDIKFIPDAAREFFDTLNIFNSSLKSPIKVFLSGKGKSLTGASDITNKIPDKYSLSQNYPNPFNPTTAINYSVPKSSFVAIKVFDLLGKEICSLVNEEKLIGNYKIEFDGSSLPSGIYFYRIQAGDFCSTKKLILLK